MVVVLIALIISANLNAKDVSEFDIKGIKLGMNKNEVSKRMPCSSYKKIYNRFKNGKVYNSSFLCGNSGSQTDAYFLVDFDHNNYVFGVHKQIVFESRPNFSKIKTKLIKRYGNFTSIEKRYIDGDYGRYIYCWGDCRSSDDLGKQLTVNYAYFLDYNNILLSLYDYKRQKDNREWTHNRMELYAKKRKEKASNIDF